MNAHETSEVQVNRYSIVSLEFLLMLSLFFFIAGCSTKTQLPTDEQRQEAQAKVPCIIVLPVETRVNADASMSYQEAAILEKGAAYMDSVLAEAVVGKQNVRILSNRQLTSLLPDDSGSRLKLIKRVGSELKCNGVLVTTLEEYRQRVGGNYGADSPASATFTMKLINSRDGRVLWTSMFKETQQSLMSNLLSFGRAESRGFKWITVEELVRQGVGETLNRCPYL